MCGIDAHEIGRAAVLSHFGKAFRAEKPCRLPGEIRLEML